MKTGDDCHLFDCAFCYQGIQEEDPYMYTESVTVCKNCVTLTEENYIDE